MAITVRTGTIDDHRAVAGLRYRMDTEDNETLVVWPSERAASAYHRAGFHPAEELFERPILHS